GGVGAVALNRVGDPVLATTVGGVNAARVAVMGPVAVAASGNALTVLDRTDASAPVARASLTLGGTVRRVRVVGHLALVAEGPAGLELIDLSNLDAPVSLGSVPAGRAEDALFASGLLVESDGIAGASVFPIPAIPGAPIARLTSPVDLAQAAA